MKNMGWGFARSVGFACAVLGAGALGCGGPSHPAAPPTTGTDAGRTDSGAADGGRTIPPCEGAACIPADFLCAGAPTLDSSHVVNLDYTVSDIVPLCSGRVLAADSTNNRLVVLSTETGAELYVIPLTASPKAISLDAASRTLLVIYSGNNSLGVVDLDTGDVTQIDVGAESSSVAAGPPGIAFVAPASSSRDWFDVGVVDLASSSVVSRSPGTRQPYRPVLRFDPVFSRLAVGDRGLSPSSLSTLHYDPATRALSSENTVEGGSNGQDLMISPDGLHIAFACGAGNGSGGYTIYDYSPSDLTSAGAWDTGAYPISAAFSPDNQLVAAFGMELRLYRVDTHAPVGANVRLPHCAYSDGKFARWMGDGSGVVILTLCGFDADTSKILYQPVN